MLWQRSHVNGISGSTTFPAIGLKAPYILCFHHFTEYAAHSRNRQENQHCGAQEW